MRYINFPMVARVLGWLLLIEALFMAVPTVAAVCYGEPGAARAFGISTLITALAGGMAGYFVRPTYRDMGKREGLLLTALVWVVFSAFGMIPYMLAPTTHLSLSAAFFEAMSGFSTTGASLVESTDQLSRTVHLWRCMSQWIGGMGIIIFTLALLPMLNSAGGMQMFNAEATGITHDKIQPRISATAQRLWGLYIGLTVALFVLLWIGPMNAFEAACHAMSTIATGGFTTTSVGIDTWNCLYVKIVLTVFMFLGSVNFVLIYKAINGQPGALFSNETFISFCRMLGVATLLYIICILSRSTYVGWESVTIDPLFQVVSFASSTGFVLNDFNNWGYGPIAIGMILMLVSGCAGSTSGGAKVDRFLYLVKYMRGEMHRILRPNAVTMVRANGRTIPTELLSKVVAFLCLFIFVTVIGGTLLCMMGVAPGDSFLASLACMTNNSPSAAFNANGAVYATMPTAAWWVLSMLMVIGRLEVFTVLMLFSRSFWHR
jgi:trk system potassium uptake protein TrkH